MARVLVVEDDDGVREIVTAHLKRAGHQVLAVETAEEALAAMDERGSADVAVLDIGLPGMDGLAMMRELRTRPGTEQLPVIFLSGNVRPEQIEEGRRTGARYLTKPFVASALLTSIERCLQDSQTW